jgi:hypothetical protein
VLTPFMASVWAYGDGGSWANDTLIERTVGPSLEAWGLLSFGHRGLPYEVFGKGFFLVYLLMLPALDAARAPLGHRERHTVVRLSAQGMYAALWGALVGDFASYWGVSIPGPLGEVLWGGGYMVEMVALLVFLVAMAVYGVAAARAGHMTWTVGALLSGAVIAVIPTVVFVTNYFPNGVVLPLSGAWALWAVSVGRNTFPVPVDLPNPSATG